MKAIAVIPARGGSKRLPRKNIIDFNGKPIIAYTIQHALESGLFERVVVSTEDQEIATIAEHYGAIISLRPESLATDHVGVVDVCLQVISEEEKVGHSYDVMSCLYATSPLRNKEDIVKTVEPVLKRACDFSMALTHYHFSPHQALKWDDDDFLQPMWPEMISKKSQEVPDFLVDNGSTYAVNLPEFKKQKTFYGKKLTGHVMPRFRSVDIDVEEDLLLAQVYSGITQT